jgi:hypothetical protein
MEIAWYVPFVAALIPLITGFIWYHKKVFGQAWIREAEMTEEKTKGANMPLIFGLTYLLSLLMCVILSTAGIHQFHIFSIFAGNPDFRTEGSETQQIIQSFMNTYGNNFRTFKHGAFHGVVLGIVCALPILGINALFERKSFKYVAINAGYWIVSMALMGGVLCAWL